MVYAGPTQVSLFDIAPDGRVLLSNDRAGIYAIGQHRWFLHSYYYYLRDLGWESVDRVDIPAVDAAIVEAGRQRPVLIDDPEFRSIRPRYRDISVPRLPLPTAILLMPGPYAGCDTSTRAAER